MNKRVSAAAAAIILGLVMAMLTVTPAQAATDWASFKAELESPTVGGASTLIATTVTGSSLQATISITTDKTIFLTGANSIQTFFAGPVFTVASGSTLTIQGVGDVDVIPAPGHSVLAGPGSVVLASGTTVRFQQGLTTGSGPVTINGHMISTNSLTLPTGTNVTVGSGGLLTVTNDLTVNGTLSPAGEVAAQNIAVFSDVTVPAGGILHTTTGSITNWGKLRIYGYLQVDVALPIVNNGTMIYMPGGDSISGGFDGNHWVALFEGQLNPNTAVYAPDFASAEIPLLWDTSWDNFMGWTLEGQTLYGSTPFIGLAVSGVFTLYRQFGAFGTGSPVADVALTGYTGGISTTVYTWSVDGTPVATGAIFTPTAPQVGGVLTLNVHTILEGYSPASSDYNKSFGVITATFATAAPTVSGLPAVGSTLVADASGSFTPGATTTGYEWFSNAVSVGTGSDYLLQSTDIGNTVKVVVSGTKANYVPASAEKSVGTIAAQPVLTLGSTTPTEGDTITVDASGLAASTDYTVRISPASTLLATLHSSPTGVISGSITIPLGTTAGAHSVSLVDLNSNPVTDASITVNSLFTTSAPAVSGLAAAGSTLVADASASFSPAATSAAYEWFSNGLSVGTAASYVLQPSDVGHIVKLVVSGTRTNFTPASAEKIVGTIAAQPVVTLGTATPNDGDTTTISVPGLAPSTDYRVELHSSPVVLATLHTSPAGLLSGSITIPAGTAGALHSIVLYDPNGNPVTSAGVLVINRAVVAALAVTGQTTLVGAGGLGGASLILMGILFLAWRRRPIRN